MSYSNHTELHMFEILTLCIGTYTHYSFLQINVLKCTGIDRTYISGVERGVRNPSLKNIEKIAKALDVKVSELIDF